MSTTDNSKPMQYHPVHETGLKLSSSKLKISLIRMYETGRQSISRKPFSITEAFLGAFVAELVTAMVYLFSSETPELILQGVFEKPIVIHVIAAVVLGVLSSLAYLIKSSMLYQNESDISQRDRAIDAEVYSLYCDPEDQQY